MTPQPCCECRDGEHENYTDVVKLILWKDPDQSRMPPKRGWVCSEHIEALAQDGYKITVVR